MKSNRTRLREEIGKRFLPELRKVGFEGPDSIRGNTPVHEFRRPGPRGTDVLTIQLEKRGLPRFVVRLHVEPPAGIDEVMARGGTVTMGSVQPRKGSSIRSWFRADPSIWKRLSGLGQTREKEAVAACLALVPEIESWWAIQKPTRHIRVWPVTYGGGIDQNDFKQAAPADR